jgi:C4-dicarboxylate-specific signal transduction histidine kinase
VLNALDAVAANPADRPKAIAVTLAQDAAFCKIIIADTGAGVPEADRERIFNPFFTTKAKGSGLGLAKVQTVAQAHGGHVTCTQGAQGGAEFCIFLDRADALAAKAGQDVST